MSSDGNRLKTRSGASVVSAKQDMSSRRSHVMNDDVLGLIFNELSVKQLLRVESVCHQFRDCVGSALKRKNGLMVRFFNYKCNEEYHVFSTGEISDAISYQLGTLRETKTYDLIESKATFGSLLKKCSHIKCLYLGSAWIDAKTIDLIVKQCPQLKRLYLQNHLSYEQTSPQVSKRALKRLLPQLSHLTVEEDMVTNITQWLPHLSSLESIALSFYLSDSVDQVLHCLPQTIRRLRVDTLFSVSVDILRNRCPLLEDLYVFTTDEEWDQLFAGICAHFPLKRLHWGNYFLSTQVFVENVSKLNRLRHLWINSFNVCLDTTAMQSMPSLKSLSLISVKCVPKMLSKLKQIFPSVRRLVLSDIIIKCECSDGNGEEAFAHNNSTRCRECVNKCLLLMSQLPRLKRMAITDTNYVLAIESNDLKLFDGLNVLPFYYGVGIEVMVHLVDHCLRNISAHKWVRLVLDSGFKEPLLQHFQDMNVTIPNNFIIKYLIIE